MQPNKGRIRPYTPEDRLPVLEIWLEASRVGHPFLTEQDLAQQQRLVDEIYLAKAEIYVAEQDNGVLGFIGLLDSHIGGLFVSPHAQGHGIGHRLVDFAFQLKGPLSVEVYAANPVAPSFYRSCGFEEIARKPHDDEGRPLELIVMRKNQR